MQRHWLGLQSRIDLKVPANLPLVSADPTLLHHILLNLLTNAAQHGGGRIVIEGKRTPDAVTLSVCDSGSGLPETGAGAFSVFETGAGTDRDRGSGLGLAIVKGFADAMGLEVTASNQDAGGSLFTIVFPEGAVIRNPKPD